MDDSLAWLLTVPFRPPTSSMMRIFPARSLKTSSGPWHIRQTRGLPFRRLRDSVIVLDRVASFSLTISLNFSMWASTSSAPWPAILVRRNPRNSSCRRSALHVCGETNRNRVNGRSWLQPCANSISRWMIDCSLPSGKAP